MYCAAMPHRRAAGSPTAFRVLGAVVVGLLLLLVATAPGRAAAGPQASAAAVCKPPKYPGVGYFTSVSATGTGCASANRLVLAYYRCRIKHGKAGRCTSTVLGYRCTEKRNSIPTEIDARVTCRRGGAKVIHTYQQDL
jgi:hypothetical protein